MLRDRCRSGAVGEGVGASGAGGDFAAAHHADGVRVRRDRARAAAGAVDHLAAPEDDEVGFENDIAIV